MVTSVVHVSSVHAADDNRITEKECRALLEAGYRVSLLTASARPVTVPNLRVIRLAPPQTRFVRLTQTLRQIFTRCREEQADLYHLHDPELIPVGLALKALGATVLYDAHEDLPEQVKSKQYLPRMAKALLPPAIEFVLPKVLARFDGVIAASEELGHKLAAPRRETIFNYPRLDEFEAAPTPVAERSLKVAYIGVLSETRGFVEMLEAAADARRAHPTLQFLLIGGEGTPGLIDRYPRLLDAAGAVWTGRQPRSEVVRQLRDVRVAFCILQPTPAYLRSIPTKVFEYMASGTPVIASDFSYWRNIYREGVVFVDPAKPQSVSEAPNGLLGDPAAATRLA
ncbi:MAG: glycosyltransferase, partial [Nannocystaceae bacterium]|nr:glycosyltransferase [Nannocystaceae bacterium]